MSINLNIHGQNIINESGLTVYYSGRLDQVAATSASVTVKPQDDNREYFDDGVCKKVGWYVFYMLVQNTTAVTGSNQVWVTANINGYSNRSFGTNGSGALCSITIPLFCTVGFTISATASIACSSALAWRTQLTVTKLL